MTLPTRPRARRSDAIGLDDVDRQMIQLLQADGRRSVNDLARRAGISRANAYQRLTRLRSSGVITGFTARTDPHLLGLDVAALIVVNADQRSWRELRKELRELPGAQYVALTAGGFDFVVLVRVPNVETLRDVVLERLQTMKGVRSTQTMFILDEHDQIIR
ncbi:MAG: Lrp/AsnC family transcriptional regulator [Acidimicrobiales bacterium]